MNTIKTVCILFLGVAGTMPGCGKKTTTTVVEKPNGEVIITQPTDSRVMVVSQPSRETVTVQPSPPPASPADTRTSAPAAGYVWVTGAYEWRNGQWVWVPGRWVKPASSATVWEPGHWEGVPGGWAWVPGHWR